MHFAEVFARSPTKQIPIMGLLISLDLSLALMYFTDRSVAIHSRFGVLSIDSLIVNQFPALASEQQKQVV
jgi:hypothetical protein